MGASNPSSCSRSEQFFQLLLLVPVPGSCSDNHSSCCHVLLTLHWTFISPAATMPYDVEEEVGLLIGHIKRLSTDGESVTFKALFDDDAVANSLESLAGTLKAAKRKGKVNYGPELLLQVNFTFLLPKYWSKKKAKPFCRQNIGVKQG